LLALLQKALGHELPNQLIAVQGMARLLEMEAGERLGPECRDYLQRLAAAALRSHETVRALVDFLRALRASAQMARFSLCEVVRETAAEVNLLFPGRTIEYDFPEQGPFLYQSAVAVRQIVGHLLRHAHQAGKRVRVGARESAAGVELWVNDNGPALAAEQQQRLFEPFACRDSAGFGLGLVLARQLVENCGGSIGVQSEVGQGSTLRVVFRSPGQGSHQAGLTTTEQS
jgi:signal transduction histidine kinase